VSDDLPLAAPRGPLNLADAPLSLRLWHWYGAAVLALTAFFILTGEQPPARAAGAVAVLAGLGASYAVAGHRLIAGGPGSSGAIAYQISLVAVFAGVVALAPAGINLLWILCPLAYLLLPFRWAVVAVAALNLVPPAERALRLHDPVAAVRAEGPLAAGGFTFALIWGAWINRLVAQNDSRAALIAELRATRAEVARLSHEAGVVAERQRLAADLHDTVAQGLSSVVMLVQAAEADAGPTGRGHLELANRTARECLAETRALVGALTPAALSGASLGDAIGRLVRRFGEETGVDSDWRVAGEPRQLPTGVEVVVLRAVQEALANVRKHAAASRAAVRLAYRPDEVELEVTDDGCGLPEDPMARGYGLRGMGTRIAQAGGRLHLSGEGGTRLRVVIPA
jgi:signal transduction histidine kinase